MAVQVASPTKPSVRAEVDGSSQALRVALIDSNGNPLTSAALATPAQATVTASATGGTLATATYAYRIAARNANGTTLAGTERTVSLTSAGSTGSNLVSWPSVAGATSYDVYGNTSGGELLMANVAPQPWNLTPLTWTDTGAITPAGALPASNTTANPQVVTLAATPTIDIGEVRIEDAGTGATAGVDASHNLLVSLQTALPAGANAIGTVGVTGTVAVTGTFWQATQPVSAASGQIVDGANVVEGALADAAVSTDAAGTLSGKLRGLVKLWNADLVAGNADPSGSVLGAGLLTTTGSSWTRVPSVSIVPDNQGLGGALTSGQYVYNGAEGNWDRVRNNDTGTALASAARTTTTVGSSITNYNARGIIVFLNITVASGTGGLQVGIYSVDPISGQLPLLNTLPTAIIATGCYAYVLYPGAAAAGVAGSGKVNQQTQGVLPRTFEMGVTVGDASSYTYSVGYALIN